MVTICTKTFCRPTIQDLILAKIRKKKEDEDHEDFFKSLKLKKEPEKPDSAKIVPGLPVPNSTFRSLQSAEKNDENNSNSESKSNNILKSSTSISKDQSIVSSLKSIKKEADKESPSSPVLLKPEEKIRTSSLLSGTNTLEELKELRDLLHKSSYVPQQKQPRRSTIEKIKIAIEKEKERQTLLDKCESTINASIESSDASTSTSEGKRKKKKVKKPSKTLTSPKKNSITSKTSKTVASEKSETTSTTTAKKGKKLKGKKKISNRINVEVQVSIIKIKKDDSSNIVKAGI